jgi:hypothetical protein
MCVGGQTWMETSGTLQDPGQDRHCVDAMVKQLRSPGSPDSHDWDAQAQEALDAARKLPHGAARSEALKKAGQLRLAADMKELLTAGPAKQENGRCSTIRRYQTGGHGLTE